MLESEGDKQALINRAEAEKSEVILRSEAAKEDSINRATGAALGLHHGMLDADCAADQAVLSTILYLYLGAPVPLDRCWPSACKRGQVSLLRLADPLRLLGDTPCSSLSNVWGLGALCWLC